MTRQYVLKKERGPNGRGTTIKIKMRSNDPRRVKKRRDLIVVVTGTKAKLVVARSMLVS